MSKKPPTRLMRAPTREDMATESTTTVDSPSPPSSLRRTATRDLALREKTMETICKIVEQIGSDWKNVRIKEAQGNLYDAYISIVEANRRFETLLSLSSKNDIMKCKSFSILPNSESGEFYLVTRRMQAEANRLNLLVKNKIERCAIQGMEEFGESEAEQFARKTIVNFGKGSPACKLWFDSVVGLTIAKEKLQTGVINGMLYPKLVWPVNNSYLMYGLPGTGKTILAKAVVNEMREQSRGNFDIFFFAPRSSDLKGGLVGETEKKIGDIFSGASGIAYKNARTTSKPTLSVIFIDEIDSIAPIGRGEGGPMAQIAASSVNTLLQVMDGIQKNDNVMLLAATNFPESIDSAVLRRFNDLLYINIPNAFDISNLINLLLSDYIDGTIESDQTLPRYLSRTPISSRYTTGSCKTDERGTGSCERPVVTLENRWEKSVAAKYIKENINQSIIATVSSRAAGNRLSGADVTRLMHQFIAKAGNIALKDGRFYEKTIEFEQPELCDNTDPSRRTVYRSLYLSSLTLFQQKDFRENASALTLYTIKDLPEFGQLNFGGITYTHYQGSHDRVIPFTDTAFDDLYFHYDKEKENITLLFDKKVIVKQVLPEKVDGRLVNSQLLSGKESEIQQLIKRDPSITDYYYKNGYATYHYYIQTHPIDLMTTADRDKSFIRWFFSFAGAEITFAVDKYQKLLEESSRDNIFSSGLPDSLIKSVHFGGYGKIHTYSARDDYISDVDAYIDYRPPESFPLVTEKPLYRNEGINFLVFGRDSWGDQNTKPLQMRTPQESIFEGETQTQYPFGKRIDQQNIRVDMVNWYLPASELISIFVKEKGTITKGEIEKMKKYNEERGITEI